MKTLKMMTTLIALLTVTLTANVLHASGIEFSDEAYINDIPFNTKTVYDETMIERGLAEFDFEDEAYIDDIPFDTECVTAQCFYQRAIKVDFNFKEETYIDDIPFDTHQQLLQMAYRNAINEVYNFSEEVYIDDIPLEIITSEIRNESMELVLSKKCE